MIKKIFDILQSNLDYLNENMNLINSKFDKVLWEHFLIQKKDEWKIFIDFILSKKHKIKYGLEIGTNFGGTFSTLCQISEEDAVLISLDIDCYPYVNIETRENIIKSFSNKNQTIHIMTEDSHDASSLLKVENILQNNKLDYLFIDGDHSYSGIKKDFEMYSNFVKDGGIIVVHDIMSHHSKIVKVFKFWEEIYKENDDHFKEIICSTRKSWGGIGIIIK